MKQIRMVQVLTGALLVFALLASIQSPVVARPTKIALSGMGDLLGSTPEGTLWTDGAGNFHFRDMTYTGSIALHGQGFDLEGTQTWVLTGYADPAGSGPFSGTVSISGQVNGQETMLWEGRIYGFSQYGLSYARVVAQGEGGQLKLDVIEAMPTETTPDPQVFELNGQLLAP